MNDRTPASGTSGPLSRATGDRSVPRQRDRGRNDVVAVVLDPERDCVNVVLAGAKLASDSGQPLALVVFADLRRSPRGAMVTADGALTVARTAFPLLEVQVALGLPDETGWQASVHGRVSRVVVDPSVAARWRDRGEPVPLTVVD